MFDGKRKWLAALGGLVVLLGALYGAWYLFIRDDPKDLAIAPITDDLKTPSAAASSPTTATGATTPATAAASATASPTRAAAAPAGATAFAIVGDRSEAAYFAPERLSRLPTGSTAKGATRKITGTFYLTSTGLATGTASAFTVEVSNLTSDEGMRDNRVRQTLETTRFPTATFTVTGLTGFPATIPSTGTGAAFKMTGTLEVHGVKKEVTWDATILRDGAVISALAKVKVRYDDFGMQPPNIANFVTVEDSLELQIQIVATAQS